MAQLTDIIQMIERIIPSQWAAKWDNPGLQTGEKSSQVKRILFSLDITSETVQEAIKTKTNLIISHHPLIFTPIKSVTDQGYPQNVIYNLIKNNIASFALHTNLDLFFFRKIGKILPLIKITPLEKIPISSQTDLSFGCKALLKKTVSLQSLCKILHDKLNVPFLTYVGSKDKKIKTLAYCPGTGTSFLEKTKELDVTITSDIKYHDAVKINEDKRAVIDIGHFHSELFYMNELYHLLKEKTAGMGITLILSKTMNNPIKGVVYE